MSNYAFFIIPDAHKPAMMRVWNLIVRPTRDSFGFAMNASGSYLDPVTHWGQTLDDDAKLAIFQSRPVALPTPEGGWPFHYHYEDDEGNVTDVTVTEQECVDAAAALILYIRCADDPYPSASTAALLAAIASAEGLVPVEWPEE